MTSKNGAAQKRTTIKKRLFLSAFREKLGNISQACEAAKVGRRTYYEWIEADAKFAIEVEDTNEAIIDWGEDRLKARMKAGDTTAIIFYLKTKGKKRGYVERQEVTGAEGRPLNEKLIVEVIHVKGAEIPGDKGGNGDEPKK